jgi:hypothetical protein
MGWIGYVSARDIRTLEDDEIREGRGVQPKPGSKSKKAELERVFMLGNTLKRGADIKESACVFMAKKRKKPSVSYYVKELCEFKLLYNEIIGAAVARFFTRGRVKIPKTRFIKGSSGISFTASKAMFDYKAFYFIKEKQLKPVLPTIKNGDVLLTLDGEKRKVRGYVAAAVVSKFIGNSDFIGFGANSGVIYKSGSQEAKAAMIDFEGSFLGYSGGRRPVDITENNRLKFLLLGINQEKFISIVPLDIDKVDNTKYVFSYNYATREISFFKFNNFFSREENAIYLKDHLEQHEVDIRDLLYNHLKHKDLAADKKGAAYEEFARTVFDIAHATDEELFYLVFGEGENRIIPGVKERETIPYFAEYLDSIYEYLTDSREKFREIYAPDIEWAKEHLVPKETWMQRLLDEELGSSMRKLFSQYIVL